MKKMIRGVCGFLALTCGLLMGAIITLSHQLPEQFSVVEGTPLNLNGAVEAGAPRSASGQTVETASLAAGSSYTAPLRLFGMFPRTQRRYQNRRCYRLYRQENREHDGAGRQNGGGIGRKDHGVPHPPG